MQCKKHLNQNATAFCFNCGNWFCTQCLTNHSNTPICKTCASTRKAISGNSDIKSLKSILKNKKLLFISSITISSLILMFLSLTLHHVFWIPFGLNLIFQGVLYKFFGSKKNLFNKKSLSGKITDAQVYTLLKMDKNELTPKRLSSATNTSEKMAKLKLNQLVIDGVLEVSVRDLELIYKKV